MRDIWATGTHEYERGLVPCAGPTSSIAVRSAWTKTSDSWTTNGWTYCIASVGGWTIPRSWYCDSTSIGLSWCFGVFSEAGFPIRGYIDCVLMPIKSWNHALSHRSLYSWETAFDIQLNPSCSSNNFQHSKTLFPKLQSVYFRSTSNKVLHIACTGMASPKLLWGAGCCYTTVDETYLQYIAWCSWMASGIVKISPLLEWTGPRMQPVGTARWLLLLH